MYCLAIHLNSRKTIRLMPQLLAKSLLLIGCLVISSPKSLSIINIIKVMLLDNCVSSAPLLFNNGLSAWILAGLQQKVIECECVVYVSAGSASSTLTDKSGQCVVVLQLAEDWVIQRSCDRSQLLSAFRCDYERQFEILRKMSQVPNRLGQADGIRFIINKQPEQRIDLSVQPQFRPQLQMFGKILSRKFIVQLGFHTSFKAIKKIGKGMTACVYNAINFATGKEVAIKSFKRSVYFAQDNNNGKASFCKEFKMLSDSNHPNICKFQGVYETQNSTYVILELYPLSLYGYLQKYGFPNETAAKTIIAHLLEGVAYLHDRGIMHRDLKLENIMVKKDGKTGQVIPVIVDLGLAQYADAPKYLYTRCGTPGYVAPEVLRIKSSDAVQTYSSACDVFSLGVIFHILMFKKPLFQGKDVKEVIRKNCDCQINFEADTFSSLSSQSLEFFRKILARNPAERLTAREALSHPYLSGQNIKVYSQQLVAQTFQTDISITI